MMRTLLTALLLLAGSQATPVGSTLEVVPQGGPSSDHPLKHRLLALPQAEPGDAFLDDTKDLLDWMARNEFTGLLVAGLVDERRGGEAAAKEAARYARTKGVAVIAEVAVRDGFVLGRPDHPFSRETLIRTSGGGLCLSKADHRDWIRRGLEGLIEAVDIDGVLLDVGDGASPCACSDCAARIRGEPTPGAGNLPLVVPLAADVFRAKRPTGTVFYGIPGPLIGDRGAELLRSLPETCVAVWPAPVDGTVPRLKHAVVRINDCGTSDVRRRRITATRSRGFRFDLENVARNVAAVREAALEGFVARAGSPKCPDNEIEALAFIGLSRTVPIPMSAFLDRVVPELYGRNASAGVLRLLQSQSAAHAGALPFWKGWDGTWEPAPGRAGEAARAMAGQIALAKSASTTATADGKRRLDAVLPILEEYRIISEAAAAIPVDGSAETRRKLAEFYEKAGLPEDLYGYKAWLK